MEEKRDNVMYGYVALVGSDLLVIKRSSWIQGRPRVGNLEVESKLRYYGCNLFP